jgi:enterochelin esterase-like enzyme
MKLSISIPDWARFIVSDLTDMERKPHPVDAARVSKFSLVLPDDVYFEYAFIDAAGEMQPDPENPQRADNPWYPNASAVLGPAYQADSFANPSEEARGRVLRQRLESHSLQQSRRLVCYTPEGFETTPLPTLYLQDGIAYYRIARLAEVLESLLKARLVRPSHLVFVEPFDRSLEYRYNPHYRRFFSDELLPFVEADLLTTEQRVLMGASLGGLVSATMALERPDLFQTVIAQSGAFVGSPAEPDFYRGKTSWVLEQIQRLEPLPLRWYLETGTLEWLVSINQKLRDALAEKGYDHAYAERHAGHNWTNWRNGLAGALRFALPPE